MALNDRQRRFVDEYLIDLDAAGAYRRAGYRPASDAAARNAASRLLANVGVAAMVAERRGRRSAAAQADAERVVRELARIAFLDPRRLWSWGPDGVRLEPSAQLSEDAAACVAEVSQTITESGGTIRLKVHSKLSALDKLARHFGVYKDRDPLEVLLAALPPELGRAVRAELARLLSAGGGAGGGPGGAPAPPPG